jgi:CelD/BcsL family acetyltransferase involved in cellulose biosynthesis
VVAAKSIEAEWDALAERTCSSPFMRPGWIRAWHDAFGRGELRVLTVRRARRLSGVLPLDWEGGRLRAPVNEHTPAFEPLAEDTAVTEALARALFHGDARTVTLERFPGDGAALQAFRTAAREAGYRELVTPLARSPYIRCRPTRDEQVRSLSRNLRHDVERRLRRLCEAGAVSVEIADGHERLSDLLEEGFALERLGWKGAEGTAITSAGRTRRFYGDMTMWAASRGWLRLAFLRLDGRAIAFQLDLEAGLHYYSLKIGYDPDYERFSPGKVLAYMMVSRAASTGLETYELLGTDEPWKHRWTDTFRDQVTLHAFAPSVVGFFAWSAFVHARPLARRLPFASRLVATIRS